MSELRKYEMNDAEKQLVTALRSGKYLQGFNVLRSDETHFCCLGVACNIFIPEKWEHDANCGTYEIENSKAILPESLREKLNWATHNGETIIYNDGEGFCLSELNDNCFTFDQIADIIEAGLVRHVFYE